MSLHRQPKFITAVTCGVVSYLRMNFLATRRTTGHADVWAHENQPTSASSGMSSRMYMHHRRLHQSRVLARTEWLPQVWRLPASRQWLG